ncbi:DUF2254 domain-containing protein [Scopulibacillus cellulosilyticus]|uniref:DUF2254 domain-containing protein n=1 Tax=Scopulibacillus cellulosilyticus TaxID=2665665 RepID=A0ABW2PWF1_9BACL
MLRDGILPYSIKKYTNMSKRERWHEIYTNLWFTPILYAFLSFILIAVTMMLDFSFGAGQAVSPFLSVSSQLTNTIVSTLTTAILSVSTFTFNSILVVFTTFSGQFSPRVLKNFIANKATQRVLGIFTGSFLYVVICFFFIDTQSTSKFFTIPLTAICLAVLSAGTFIFFINHSVKWLQVNHMTENMKAESVNIIQNSLQQELDPYRVEETDAISAEFPECPGHQVVAPRSGYIQVVDFINLIEEAKKDNLLIKMEVKVGDYNYASTPMLKYWKKDASTVDEYKYQKLISVGKHQTEIQDIEFSINKLVEVAIRSLGNNDPKTAINTIYQIGDLLVLISQIGYFAPYLKDKCGELRIILKDLSFEDYLHVGFGCIRHYSRDNVLITIEMLKALKLMAQSIHPNHYQSLWDFAAGTAEGLESDWLFNFDNRLFYKALFDLAEITKNEHEYKKLKQKVSCEV